MCDGILVSVEMPARSLLVPLMCDELSFLDVAAAQIIA
jgi:hypothetical protein